MASPWLPSSASLKAFQESLLFVQMESHSPKACIPTLSGCLSSLSPTPIKKAREDPSTLLMLGTFKDTQLECLHQRPRAHSRGIPTMSIRQKAHVFTDHNVEQHY